MVDFGPKDKERENMDEDAKKSDEDKAVRGRRCRRRRSRSDFHRLGRFLKHPVFEGSYWR